MYARSPVEGVKSQSSSYASAGLGANEDTNYHMLEEGRDSVRDPLVMGDTRVRDSRASDTTLDYEDAEEGDTQIRESAKKQEALGGIEEESAEYVSYHEVRRRVAEGEPPF